jgi:hypothetical protein
VGCFPFGWSHGGEAMPSISACRACIVGPMRFYRHLMEILHAGIDVQMSGPYRSGPSTARPDTN